MSPRSLENISNFEGWGLTLLAYKKISVPWDKLLNPFSHLQYFLGNIFVHAFSQWSNSRSYQKSFCMPYTHRKIICFCFAVIFCKKLKNAKILSYIVLSIYIYGILKLIEVFKFTIYWILFLFFLTSIIFCLCLPDAFLYVYSLPWFSYKDQLLINFFSTSTKLLESRKQLNLLSIIKVSSTC